MKFYTCPKCGNIIAYASEKHCTVQCCGEPMVELVPNTTDAAQEKHVPDVTVDGNLVTVKIGSAAHPMTDAHHISWVALHTKQGNQRKTLDPTGTPEVQFALVDGDAPIAAYAYCNLHGLWKKEI